MNNKWSLAKFGLMLLVLPLVATAAASAHLQIVQSSPIKVGTAPLAVAPIGLDRVHTVALNRYGGVDGRILEFNPGSNAKGLSKLKVSFVQNGHTISQAITDSKGVFAAQNVPEGTYAFIASGDNGFAAYSVRVVADGKGKHPATMEAVAVPQVASVKSILDSAPQTTQPGPYKASMDEKGANRVVLKNGILTGRMLSPKVGGVQNTEVHILQDGVSIARVMVDEKGEYQVPDMKPGIYALVAIGPRGVAAVAFEAVELDDQTNNSVSGTVYVSTSPQDPAPQDGVGQATPIYTDVLNVYLIQSDSVPQPATQDDDGAALLPIEYAGESVAFGGTFGSVGAPVQSFATTYTGGAGGGGRLLGIAGVTLGVVALSNTGSDPPPASPITP